MHTELPARPLAEVLLEQHLVTEDELEECRQIDINTHKGLANILIEKEYVDEVDLAAAFCDCLGLVHVRASKVRVNEDVLTLVPENLARRYQVLPLAVSEGSLTLAMVDPFSLTVFDTLSRLTSLEIEPVVAVRSELIAAIERNYSHRGDTEEEEEEEIPQSLDGDESDVEEVVAGDMEIVDVTAAKAAAESEPVKKLVNRILRDALRLSASDIHIEPFEKHVSLRYRVDGSLEDAKRPPKKLQSRMIARFKILSGNKIDEHRLPQDGRIRIRFEGRDIDFRVGYLPCRYGEKIVLRILDKGSLTLDLDLLGFEAQPMEAFRNALARPNGMVLMTGPTGSGKTTTLYSALHKLNSREVNIVTVEDPIEYDLEGINQVQVHASIGLTFAEALRQILRQDPDIVMVGEIRDQETADVSVKAALTGHLVLSTLHTNDASGVFPRLIDMGLEPFLVQSSVVLAAAQRLLKKVCPECKQRVEVGQDVLQRIQFAPMPGDPPPAFVQGRGCHTCKDTGYKGRVAVIEAMPNYPEVGRLVLQKASGMQIKTVAMENGMRTLRQNALAKAAQGVTSISQVLEHTIDDQIM